MCCLQGREGQGLRAEQAAALGEYFRCKLVICKLTMNQNPPNRVQKVTTVSHFGTSMSAGRAVWDRAPRRTTEPLLKDREPKVAQGLHLRSKVCVLYKPKRRDVHDLQ